MNERSHVPKVDGANGSNGSTAPAEPARSLFASSMNEPPTSIDAATDSALAPEPRPDPGGRTAASISASQPEAVHHRARQQQPRIRHQRPVVETNLQPVDPTRYAAHRKCLLTWPE